MATRLRVGPLSSAIQLHYRPGLDKGRAKRRCRWIWLLTSHPGWALARDIQAPPPCNRRFLILELQAPVGLALHGQYKDIELL